MRLKTLPVLAVIAVAGGLLFAWSGLVSVAASSGHYAITNWFLHYTMRQAVKTQSFLVEVPSGVLDDAGQVALGAVHYADGCAPCHGAPGEPRSPLMLAMAPPPPSLPRVIPTWDTEELFWIIRHGVKYSGMPAWPAQARADEVWAVVAFLRALPDLDAASYLKLVSGPEAAPPMAQVAATAAEEEFENILAGCARCHGRDGAGRPEGGVPWIGGQSQAYLAATLRAYAEGRRFSGIMQPQAAAVPHEQLGKLAAYYARQHWPAEDDPGSDHGTDSLGASIALDGVPSRGIPACASCHGPPPRYIHYPRVSGQDAGFIARQLMLFRDGERGGTVYRHLMPVFVDRLTDSDIAAISAFYAQRATQSPSDRTAAHPTR
jgi:cytochrome c553